MFKKHYEKLLSFMIAFILVIGCTGINAVKASATGTTTVGNGKYAITSTTNLTAQYEGTAKKSATSASIPDTIKIGNKTYKVTSIANNALKNNTKIKKMTIGKNVEKIGKSAFCGCKNLKTITIKTTALTPVNVGAKSFKGLHAKVVITVPQEKLAYYKAILKSNGLYGSKQKVKGKKMEEESTSSTPSNPVSTFNPTEPQFDLEQCKFEIKSNGNQSSSYSVGDTITLQSRVRLKPTLYGHWEKESRKLTKGYVQCAKCLECFSNYMLGVHNSMELFPGACEGSYFIGMDGKTKETWAFIPDSDPCKTVFQYILPQGFSYKEGSLKVTETLDLDDLTNSCVISVSGNCVTVTINDIKSNPFYYPFDYESYKKDLYFTANGKSDTIRPIVVEIGVEINNNINANSVISSTTSYSYKGTQFAQNYEASINTASLCISNTDADGNDISGAEFSIYQMKTTYKEGSTLGTSDWSLLASGVHAGDVISGLGKGKNRMENEYRIEQTKVPEGYQTPYPFEFELFIGEDGTVSAEDEDGNKLEVKNGVINVNFQNKKK